MADMQESVGSIEAGERQEKRYLCLDLGAADLPVLRNGFVGTEKLIQWLNRFPCYSEREDPKSLDDETPAFKHTNKLRVPKRSNNVFWLYSLVTCALYIVLLYLDWSADTELGSPQTLRWEHRLMGNCGVNASNCRPFETEEWIPARCERFAGVSEVYGSDLYKADGLACASAIHAGVISNFWGGCFAYRFRGEQTSFSGSERNGIVSKSFGWFPKSMEFKAIASSRCNTVQPWLDAYSFGIFILLVFFVRPTELQAFGYLVTEGFLYLSTHWLKDSPMVWEFNYTFAWFCFVIVPISYLMFLWYVQGTLPDPRRYPFDIILFYFVPYWCGIRMDNFTKLGFDITLTSSVLSSTAYIIGFLLLIGIMMPLVVAQCVLHYRAGTWRGIVTVLAVLVAVALILSLTSGEFISFHLHHYFLGMLGVLFFRGQPWCRFSIIMQGLALGAFVNGVIIWGSDPFFDPVVPKDTNDRVLFWSAMNVSGTSISLEWATRDTLLREWGCSASLVQEIAPVRGRVPTLRGGSESLVLGRRGLLSLGRPPRSKPESKVSANGILLLQDYLDPLGNSTGVWSYARSDLVPFTNYTFSMDFEGARTKPLPIVVNETWVTATYYNPLNATFASDPCQRVYAIHAALK